MVNIYHINVNFLLLEVIIVAVLFITRRGRLLLRSGRKNNLILVFVSQVLSYYLLVRLQVGRLLLQSERVLALSSRRVVVAELADEAIGVAWLWRVTSSRSLVRVSGSKQSRLRFGHTRVCFIM